MNNTYSQRMIHVGHLQNALYMRKPYIPLPNSTLNQKFGVNADVTLEDGEYPYLGYFCIGRGGHAHEAAADSGVNIVPVESLANHSALKKHLPFVCRPLDNDLGDIEREKYALRVIEEHHGVQYAVYYLRRLELDAAEPIVEVIVLEDGEIVSRTPYTPSINDLSPQAITINQGDYIPTEGKHLKAYATVNILFTEADVQEVLNAVAIIYQDESYGIISEIGLCSGVDRTVSSPDGIGGTITMKEACVVQLNNAISTLQPINFSKSKFNVDIDVGSAEPLTVDTVS